MNILIKLSIIFVLFLSVVSFPASEAANENVVKIYTSYFPPIVSDNKEMPGFAYEIVKRIFEISKVNYKIIHYPWARSQSIVENTPETLIFPLTRTKTREDLFRWSFKIFKTQTHFVTINGKKLDRESARTKLIGVQRESSWDNWLKENKYTKVKRLESEKEQLSKMLLMGRLDAWFVERSVAEKNLKSNGTVKITYSDPIVKFNTYLATNKKVPYSKIDLLKKSFLTLIRSGEYEEILQKYQVSSKKVTRNEL